MAARSKNLGDLFALWYPFPKVAGPAQSHGLLAAAKVGLRASCWSCMDHVPRVEAPAQRHVQKHRAIPLVATSMVAGF